MTQHNGSYETFIGIDVDQKSYAFTVKDKMNLNSAHKIPARAENLYKYIATRYPIDTVQCAYEVGGTGYHLHDYLTSRGVSCIMVSPPSMPKASTDRVKNNRLDSEKIAQHLKTGTLPSIRVPDHCYRDLRHLVHSREDYVRSGRVAKQRIKSLLLFEHLHEAIKDPGKSWSHRYMQALKDLVCSPVARQRLDHLLQDLSYNREQNLHVLRQLKSFIEQNQAINKNLGYLRSIPGIGFVTAVSLLANIGDPERLERVSELGAFIGLVPSEHSTGDHVAKGSITRLGNRTLRSLLVEAAWITIQHDLRLRQFYDRIRAKHHPSIGSRKAIVAVARKLTMIAYRVLKDQRNYIAL
jgi:transposase